MKATELGAKVVTLSDSSGYIHDPEGISPEKLEYVMELKNIFRGRIKEYAEKYPSATYYPGERPWGVKCDIAMPCATQNELNGDEAQALVEQRLHVRRRRRQHALDARSHQDLPAAQVALRSGQGGQRRRRVATSGLEMTQNSMRITWSSRRGRRQAEVDHEEHPRGLRPVRHGARRLYQLRRGRQHRRLHEGRQCHARPGLRLTVQQEGGARTRPFSTKTAFRAGFYFSGTAVTEKAGVNAKVKETATHSSAPPQEYGQNRQRTCQKAVVVVTTQIEARRSERPAQRMATDKGERAYSHADDVHHHEQRHDGPPCPSGEG